MYEHGGNVYGYEAPMVDFSANINPLGIPESVLTAWMKKMKEVSCYPDPQYRKLKNAITDHFALKKKGEVVLGNGAVDLIHAVVACIAPREVLIPSPAFSEYRNASLRHKVPYREPVLYDAKGNLRLEKLLEEIKEHSLVFLCNPNNPTGKALDNDTLEAVFRRIQHTESYLVLDETFFPFVERGKRHTLMSTQPERVMFLNALTKIYGIPGVRLGYGILFDEALARKMEAHQQPWHINTFANIAGQVALHDTRYLENTEAWLKCEKAFLYEELSKISWIRWSESDCNFILAYSKRHTAKEIQEKLLEEKILIRLPHGFMGLTPHHFRIAIKDRSSNMKLIQALTKLTDIR